MRYMHKTVNGKSVALTSVEVAEFEARDAEWVAGKPARQAAIIRIDGLTADAEAAQMVVRLSTMNSQQIDDYFAANVQTPGQAIRTLKAICKLLAVRLITPRL